MLLSDKHNGQTECPREREGGDIETVREIEREREREREGEREGGRERRTEGT